MKVFTLKTLTPHSMALSPVHLLQHPLIEAAFNGLSLSPVDILQHSGNDEVICVLVEVLQVNKQRGWYKIELMVSDDSGCENITVFDRDAFNYIGMIANDLAAEKLKVFFLSQYYLYHIIK
ncbi:uncharacterized protein G2W53_010455 [Senna tora]|uniref:Uncharacterized protein n=1 Tax=Senna tora TaxID=362788 RepID=A0A834WZY7_9FABA|nr:uncharacterized protein G2W53_010455 [Senna tora]